MCNNVERWVTHGLGGEECKVLECVLELEEKVRDYGGLGEV